VISCLKPLNITHTQFVVLTAILWLEDQHQIVTQASVVAITGIDKMTLSKSLKNLVFQGFVVKSKNESDSRSLILRLSDDGELLTKKALFLIEKLDEEFFGIIGQKKENDFRELLLEYKKCL
uniref:MarR family winged helix-turn-helix transcriptional regulator n=3 Tax=Pseudomonadota TaxID=1224 RepID=UPI0030805FF6